MTYEVVMPYHLHMPSYFLGTFTEYPYIIFNPKTEYTLCLFNKNLFYEESLF